MLVEPDLRSAERLRSVFIASLVGVVPLLLFLGLELAVGQARLQYLR